MGKAYIIDPVCAITYGHSLNALGYFEKIAHKQFSEVVKVASRHLPAIHGSKPDDIIRFFDFYYDFAMRIERRESEREHPWQIDSKFDEGVRATVDFERFLREFDISESDTLIYPSIDYYSLLGLLNRLETLPPSRCPNLRFRFIGVMENASRLPDPQKALKVLEERLAFHITRVGRTSISAETPRLARILEKRLGSKVHTTPYIVFDLDALPLLDKEPFTVLSGGSARPDKGFFRLSNIIDMVNDQMSPGKVRFIVQNLPDHEISQFRDYFRTLAAKPNVEILPGSIPYANILDAFGRCDVTILPYDPDIYRFRGSAMLMESIVLHRPAICQARTAFAEQCRLYSAGTICESDQDFADAVCTYSGIPAELRKRNSRLAAEQYLGETKTAHFNWLEGAR